MKPPVCLRFPWHGTYTYEMATVTEGTGTVQSRVNLIVFRETKSDLGTSTKRQAQ